MSAVHDPFQAIPPTSQIEKAFGVSFSIHKNMNVYCPFHPDEQGHSKSCSVSADGYYKCHVCLAKGKYYEFYAQVHDITPTEALARINIQTPDPATLSKAEQLLRTRFDTRTQGGLSDSIPYQCHNMLMHTHKWKQFLSDRGLTLPTLEKYMIGCDEYRITIPIYSKEGKLINIRRYLPHADKLHFPKMVSHVKGDGTPTLYPYRTLSDTPKGNQLIICEGEWDALITNQHGLPAITNTGGASVWNHEWTKEVAGYHCVVIYDVNDNINHPPMSPSYRIGERQMFAIARALLNGDALSVRPVTLPLTNEGGDLTDYFALGNTGADLQALIDSHTNMY